MKKKRRKKKKSLWRGKAFWWILMILNVCILVSIIGVISANFIFKKKIGTSLFQCAVEGRQAVIDSKPSDFVLNKTTYIYSDDDTVIAKLSDSASSNYLPYEEIPEHVKNAFIAIEDRTFWSNKGVDPKGMIRVLLRYYQSDGAEAHGASTITQQLARSVFLSTEKSIERKVREIFIAYFLNQKYPKEKIMEYYVNNCCFANNIYGIKDAAKTYLGKSVSELSLSEIAYLCAIPNRPQYYDPFNNSENALSRRDKILKDMKSCDYISDAEYTEAINTKINVIPRKTNKKTKLYNYPTTYAVKCAVEYLMKRNNFSFCYHFDSEADYKNYLQDYNICYEAMERALYTGGYQIHTSISLDATKRLQNIVDETLDFSQKTNPDTNIYNLQGALTVIDNESGKVVATIGGRSQEETIESYSLNRAFQIYRQPGSTMKPLIVYTPAFDKHLATPSTLLKNIDVSSAYKHEDDISSLNGRDIPLRTAVEQSLNGCALYLYDQVTPSLGLSYLENMHFSRIVPEDFSLSSGLGGFTYGTNTEEMANAYYTLEQHGQFQNIDCIVSMKDYSGNELYSQGEPVTVYSETAADTMTDVMQGVLVNGTGRSMNWIRDSHGMTASGKTGTTNDMRDGWFCGYSPYYTISVWVGNDDSSTVNHLYGSTYPGTIWKKSMIEMTGDRFSVNFQLNPIKE